MLLQEVTKNRASVLVAPWVGELLERRLLGKTGKYSGLGNAEQPPTPLHAGSEEAGRIGAYMYQNVEKYSAYSGP